MVISFGPWVSNMSIMACDPILEVLYLYKAWNQCNVYGYVKVPCTVNSEVGMIIIMVCMLTHIHTYSRMPNWVQYMIPKIFYTVEKAWNYYPYTRTGKRNAFFIFTPCYTLLFSLPMPDLMMWSVFEFLSRVYSKLLIVLPTCMPIICLACS